MLYLECEALIRTPGFLFSTCDISGDSRQSHPEGETRSVIFNIISRTSCLGGFMYQCAYSKDSGSMQQGNTSTTPPSTLQLVATQGHIQFFTKMFHLRNWRQHAAGQHQYYAPALQLVQHKETNTSSLNCSIFGTAISFVYPQASGLLEQASSVWNERYHAS